MVAVTSACCPLFDLWLNRGYSKSEEQSYLLIVDHTGDPDVVFKSITDAAVPHIHNGMYVDMLEYNSPTGKNATRGNPFYRKPKRFLFA